MMMILIILKNKRFFAIFFTRVYFTLIESNGNIVKAKARGA